MRFSLALHPYRLRRGWDLSTRSRLVASEYGARYLPARATKKDSLQGRRELLMLWRLLGTAFALMWAFNSLQMFSCPSVSFTGGRFRATWYCLASGGVPGPQIGSLILVASLGFIAWAWWPFVRPRQRRSDELPYRADWQPSAPAMRHEKHPAQTTAARDGGPGGESRRTCNRCGSELDEQWTVCPYCFGGSLCSACGRQLESDWVMCPYCGNKTR